MDWHRPTFYRYRVADDVARLRPTLNRYPGHVIGAAIAVGPWAYCMKWASL